MDFKQWAESFERIDFKGIDPFDRSPTWREVDLYVNPPTYQSLVAWLTKGRARSVRGLQLGGDNYFWRAGAATHSEVERKIGGRGVAATEYYDGWFYGGKIEWKRSRESGLPLSVPNIPGDPLHSTSENKN